VVGKVEGNNWGRWDDNIKVVLEISWKVMD
jgi:hypothetical protein